MSCMWEKGLESLGRVGWVREGFRDEVEVLLSFEG